jgi:hypothetical protein
LEIKMSKNKPAVPKGRACGLNQSNEYIEGALARHKGEANGANPYNFFDKYEENYGWDMGWQEWYKFAVKCPMGCGADAHLAFSELTIEEKKFLAEDSVFWKCDNNCLDAGGFYCHKNAWTNDVSQGFYKKEQMNAE